MKYFILVVFVLLLNGCDFKKVEDGDSPKDATMKCGAGKCGANMFNDNAALVKKKKNILSQMSEDDNRSDCVKKAKTTKKAYDCVRDPDGKKMINKPSKSMQEAPVMKCGAGKCGSSMK